ncbi:MAG: iron-sulfur cluster assembly scaffold protein [Anaerolineales bacterium]|nr:iron-sulfur cluster assembly scaffold protein [Anaerolineales bacterium]
MEENMSDLIGTIPVMESWSKVEKRLTGYSEKVLKEAADPNNMLRMEGADAAGIVHGCCGDTMEIFLRLDNGNIQEAAFMTDGRESAIACASMLTRLVKGMSLDKANKLTPEVLITALDGLPPAKVHCATLTINTFKNALVDAYSK